MNREDEKRGMEEFLRTTGATVCAAGLANAPSPLTRPEVAKRAARRSGIVMSQKARAFAEGMKIIFTTILDSGITDNAAIADELNRLNHKSYRGHNWEPHLVYHFRRKWM